MSCALFKFDLFVMLELFRYRFWFCQWLGRFYYDCHLILTFVIFFFTCSLLNFNDTSKHSLVSWLLLLLFFFFFFFRAGWGGGGLVCSF